MALAAFKPPVYLQQPLQKRIVPARRRALFLSAFY
jgi:hypothetical protein